MKKQEGCGVVAHERPFSQISQFLKILMVFEKDFKSIWSSGNGSLHIKSLVINFTHLHFLKIITQIRNNFLRTADFQSRYLTNFRFQECEEFSRRDFESWEDDFLNVHRIALYTSNYPKTPLDSFNLAFLKVEDHFIRGSLFYQKKSVDIL